MSGELIVLAVVAAVAASVLGTIGRRLQQLRYQLHPLTPGEVAGFQQRLDGLEAVYQLSPNQALNSGKRLVDEMLTAIGLPQRETDKRRLRDLKIVDSRCYRAYRDAIKTRKSSNRDDMHKTLEYYEAISKLLLDKASPRPLMEEDQPAARV